MYYDNEFQIEKSIEIIIDDFLDKLSEFHINQNSDGIKKILKIQKVEVEDKNDFKHVGIKGNDHLKKIMAVIRQIIAEKVFNVWIGNVLTSWNYKLNNLLELQTILLLE